MADLVKTQITVRVDCPHNSSLKETHWFEFFEPAPELPDTQAVLETYDDHPNAVIRILHLDMDPAIATHDVPLTVH